MTDKKPNDSSIRSHFEAGVVLSSHRCPFNPSLRRIRIGQEGDLREVWGPDDQMLAEALEAPLRARSLHLYDAGSSDGGNPLLLACPVDPFNDGFTHLPESACPVEGIVLGIKHLVSGIRSAPLHTFLVNVFERRDVFQHFWTMPASRHHHHSRGGGLAAHSMEVADDLASHERLADLELDLGVAGALLHDIGKVWSYNQDMTPNDACKAMGHELLGLSRLEPQLTQLERVWPDGAYVMRCLLSGQTRMRQDGSFAPALLPRIKACDQRSCELDRASRHARRSTRAWTPQPWTDSWSPEDMQVE